MIADTYDPKVLEACNECARILSQASGVSVALVGSPQIQFESDFCDPLPAPGRLKWTVSRARLGILLKFTGLMHEEVSWMW